MKLSEWLNEQLRLRDTNAYGISHALGVSPRTVYKWLDGTHTPDPTNCRKLAYFFGILEHDVLMIAGHLSAAREPLSIYTTDADHDLGTVLRLFKNLSPNDRRRILAIMRTFKDLPDE